MGSQEEGGARCWRTHMTTSWHVLANPRQHLARGRPRAGQNSSHTTNESKDESQEQQPDQLDSSSLVKVDVIDRSSQSWRLENREQSDLSQLPYWVSGPHHSDTENNWIINITEYEYNYSDLYRSLVSLQNTNISKNVSWTFCRRQQTYNTLSKHRL